MVTFIIKVTTVFPISTGTDYAKICFAVNMQASHVSAAPSSFNESFTSGAIVKMSFITLRLVQCTNINRNCFDVCPALSTRHFVVKLNLAFDTLFDLTFFAKEVLVALVDEAEVAAVWC